MEWQIALFSGIGAILCGIILSGVGFAFVISNRVTRIESSLEFWIDSMGRLAAKKLHSPDDHLGIDAFLDIYIQNAHTMTLEQWSEFKLVCLKSRSDPLATKAEKAYAEFLIELCEYKMSLARTKKP
jgi:hypothetical protein